MVRVRITTPTAPWMFTRMIADVLKSLHGILISFYQKSDKISTSEEKGPFYYLTVACLRKVAADMHSISDTVGSYFHHSSGVY